MSGLSAVALATQVALLAAFPLGIPAPDGSAQSLPCRYLVARAVEEPPGAPGCRVRWVSLRVSERVQRPAQWCRASRPPADRRWTTDLGGGGVATHVAGGFRSQGEPAVLAGAGGPEGSPTRLPDRSTVFC